MNPLIPAILGGVLGAAQDAPGPAAPPAPQAAIRPIPLDAAKAVMEPPVQGYARFGDKTLWLAAGLQIRDTHNRIVLPVSVSEPVAVRYLIDAGGAVSRVWMLTPGEAAQPDSK